MNGSLLVFLARRLVLLALTMVLVPSVTFVMFSLIAGQRTAPSEVLADLGSYLAGVFLQGELGEGAFRGDTFIRTRSALDVVRDGFLVDCYLLLGSICFAVVVGLLAGRLQATRPHSAGSRAVTVVTAVALSSPVFFLGLVVLLLFAPGTGAVAEIPFLSRVAGYRAPESDLGGFLHHVWLPCVIIGTPLAGACTRMCASQLASALEEDFVRTARGKGMRERSVVWRHAMPAAAAPVVALVAVNMNLILTNVALVEVVFNMPGSFRYVDRALRDRDVDLVQALVVEATLFIVVANFAADALQGWLDPRVRAAGR